MKTTEDLKAILKKARFRLAKKQCRELIERLARAARKGRSSVIVNERSLCDEAAQLIDETPGLYIDAELGRADIPNGTRYIVGLK